ncbi:hypothetical protein K438DRAFT_1802660 [Mycena galopus ATCC 62051]|nr:hypothetical protein K438DRAFT_1802660 [Mycena galopus ATCC 62051]
MEGAAALSKDTREEIGELGASMNIVEGETDLGLLGDAARRYGETLIEGAAAMSKDAREKIGALRERMNTVVQAARALHDDIQATMLEKRQIDSDTNDATESAGDFSGDLERAFGTVLDEMQVIFPAPEEALVHGERQKVVAATLDKVGTALVTVCVKYKMDEERVRSLWEVIREAIEKLIVLLGDVAEQHPLLIEVLLFAFMLLVSDQIWFLRRLLRILGFGQAGPMKGTAASWAQRVFYGPAVSKGSWFSFLQKTAMGG